MNFHVPGTGKIPLNFLGVSDIADIDAIFALLFSYVQNSEKFAELRIRYEKARTIPSSEREAIIISLYQRLETFLAAQSPPVVNRNSTIDDLHGEIQKKLPIERLSIGFQLIYLPIPKRKVLLYSMLFILLSRSHKKLAGAGSLETLAGSDYALSVLAKQPARFSDWTVDSLIAIREATDSEALSVAFEKLFKAIYQKLVTYAGDKRTREILGDCVALLVTIYNYNILHTILDEIPESIAGERLNFYSKEEIRIYVQAKSKELEIVKKELEEKVSQMKKQDFILEDTKKAMQNLLEDARHAEIHEKRGKEELRNAMDKIGQFASIADGERHTYLLLLSSIGEGVFVVDTNRIITIVNRAAEEIFGFSKDELIGRRFTDILKYVRQDNTPLEGAFWDSAFNSKTPVILPPGISVKGKSGKLVPIADVISPIIDTHTNEHKGIIITFRDVSEERALEDARINFISIASHQLRTPLTSMRWFSEMLMAGDAGVLSEDQKHFVDRIYQGTDRMINLVNLLLQIARVEAGRLKIEPIPVDLKNTVSGVQLILKANIESKSITIDIRTNPDPFPQIPLDQDVIWHVFQNLISNAVRYSYQKATIWVNIEKKDDCVLCSVKDTGIGIPENQKIRVFEKFFRAENAIKLVPEGSGLGTSLVKLLVEGWGGKIWFESEINKGTTFFFTIPFSGMKAREGDVKLAV